MHNVDFRSKEFDKKQDVIEKDFIFFLYLSCLIFLQKSYGLVFFAIIL